MYFSFFRSHASSILDSYGTVSSIMINSLFMLEYSIISSLSRDSISNGKTSRLSRSTRKSQSVALLNKPTLCSMFFLVCFLSYSHEFYGIYFRSFRFAFFGIHPFEFYVVWKLSKDLIVTPFKPSLSERFSAGGDDVLQTTGLTKFRIQRNHPSTTS